MTKVHVDLMTNNLYGFLHTYLKKHVSRLPISRGRGKCIPNSLLLFAPWIQNSYEASALECKTNDPPSKVVSTYCARF